MTQRVIKLAGALLGLFALSTAVVLGDNSNNGTPTNMAVAPPTSAKAGPIHLAIGALGLRDAERDNQFADLLAVRLASAGGFELVERQSLDKSLREAEMTLSGLARGTNAIRVGALTRADWFLLGTPTVVGGTNSVFLRIVDARSGRILRVQIFPETLSSPALAEKAAAFVIQSRELSRRGVPQVYLAVGTFQDVGLNNRFATFPSQFRSYLTAAYEGSQITVLERESVEPLLKEMQLDLAGLTAESAAGPPKMDAAFWLVDGYYQSYETAAPEVDLVLRIERVFGGTRMMPLREKPGEELLRHAKEAVDAVMAKNAEQMTATTNENFQKGGDVVAGPRAVVAVAQISFANQPGPATNKSEIDLQMTRGRQMLGMDYRSLILPFLTDNVVLGGMSVVDPVKKRENVEGAIHAFETVLLLDPDNRDAKMYLATCLRFTPLADLDAARGYYRDIIAAPVKDGVAETARMALAFSYVDSDPQKALELFKLFATQITNPYNIRTCQAGMSSALQNIRNRNLPVPEMPEEHLPDPDTAIFAKIEEVAAQAGKSDGVPIFDFGPVQNVYRDPLPTQKHIEELLPKLKAKFPELTPYLLYQAHRYQAESNSTVMKEFGENLDWCVNNPEKVYHGRSYFSELFWRWDFNQGFFDVAAHIASVRQQAMKKEWSAPLDPPRRVEMAYVYMAVNRWKDALDIFETFGNRVVNVGNLSEGPWGSPFDPFIPARAADECRKHLGIAPSRDEVRFELITSVARSEYSFAFTPDGDSAWLAVRKKLYVCRSTEKPDREIPLPLTGNADVTCMAMSAGKIWIGTAGEGLVEYDIASGTARKFTETDGLTLNSVSSLFLRKDSLWIGFGNGSRAAGFQWGGVGRMDLKTHQFSAFTPPLQTGDRSRGFHFDSTIVRRNLTNFTRDANGRLQLDPVERARIHDAGVRRYIDLTSHVGPPRNKVMQITEGAPGEMWMAVWDAGIVRYYMESNIWETLSTPDSLNKMSSLAFSQKRVLAGCMDPSIYPNMKDGVGFGLHAYRTEDAQWPRMAFQDSLPSNIVTALASDGPDVWIGGDGYVAVANLDQDKIRKICYTRATIGNICVKDGFAWIQTLPAVNTPGSMGCLYRVALSTLK